ncbi:MAG: hypothetical protein ACXWUG_10110 [Polyangiales bacterium]
MKLSLLSTTRFASALLLVVAGCGRAAVPSAASAHTPDVANAALAGKRVDKTATAATPEVASTIGDRHVGDFVVFKFSGAFHKGAMTLTERVIAKEGTILTVEFTLAEGGKDGKSKEQTLRVKMDQKVGGKGEVFGVQKIEKGVATPAEVADWEAMMAKTVLFADTNEETLASEDIKIDVAGKSVDAQKTSYKVLVGNKTATMTITQSEGFAWGDLGGEIISADGTVLYRAELVEAGSAPPSFVATDDDI